MLAPRIDIHIGDAKTGTTTLQSILAKNVKALESQGIVYVKSGRANPNAIGHHFLPREILDGAAQGKTNHWQEFRREVLENGHMDRFLVSSEGFSSIMHQREAARLKQCLEDFDVRFYLVVRKPDEWIESIYLQFIKGTPYARSNFSKFTQNFELRGYTAGLLLAEQFGAEAVHVLKYSEDIIKQLIGKLDLTSIVSLDESRIANVRPPSQLAQAFFALNHVAMPDDKRKQLYDYITNYCKNYSSDMHNAEGNDFLKFGVHAREKYLESKRGIIQKFSHTFNIALDDFMKVEVL